MDEALGISCREETDRVPETFHLVTVRGIRSGWETDFYWPKGQEGACKEETIIV